MKSKPPSRIRYEASHPVVSVRVSEADHAALKSYLQKKGINAATLLMEAIGVAKQDNVVGVVEKRTGLVPLSPQPPASPPIVATPQEQRRRMPEPEGPNDTMGEVRGRVFATTTTLQYYQRMNADFLAWAANEYPPDKRPAQYPGGMAGWIEDCVVGYYERVLKKKLVWLES